MEPVLILGLFSGFVVILGGIVFLAPYLASPPAFGRASQGRPMPFRRHTILFSSAERSLYRALRSFVPDYMIFAKVRLVDLVTVSPQQPFWQRCPLNRKYIDFVVCDATLSPVLAIELDDMHKVKSNRSGDDEVTSMLESASLPVVHIPHRRRYLFNELRRLLRPYLTLPHPLV